ncbi:MAG: division/cell wall cluster transcriptional repressor MraZ [Anaerolineales bacterium]
MLEKVYTVVDYGNMWGFVGRRRPPGVRLFLERSEHMFLGQYRYSIDEKGRITIPARFRASLETGAYVTQGFERNLLVYTTASFEHIAAQTNSLSATNAEAREVRRMIFGRASDVSLDSAGRILIPVFLRDYAGLDSEVEIVGAGVYFEIWSPDEWAEVLVSVTDADRNAQRFSDFDLSVG